MLDIIQEFQSKLVVLNTPITIDRNPERKGKTTTTSLNTFQSQKAALYAQARQNATTAARDGNDYLHV
jgi:hypothetical protein